ncbi:hypothetical protein [Desulfomonile tiedjei]|uniref:Uncharacterized protein n=1 Tax=Desulfomonile tiedjei (strain ATCC 49306 / DSM 6799 / DCB-1) TaxID=706587 RepID=I4CD19_DESTA|nr:hypothetical protein [Desulfomonile tiedjei]AFM27460.1 hypothetical protein Desti_4846 [Desulfomonile tiedjei DSM 6799]
MQPTNRISATHFPYKPHPSPDAALFAAAALAHDKHLDHHARIHIIANLQESPPDRSFDALHLVRTLGESAKSIGFSPNISRYLDNEKMESCALQAQDWIQQGVTVFVKNQSEVTEFAESLPALLFACGDLALLQGTRTAVLNSRTGRSPDDLWIRSLKSALENAMTEDPVFVSSYGTCTYELVCVIARNAKLIIVCPDLLPCMMEESCRASFDAKFGDLLDADQALMISPYAPGSLPDSRTCRIHRDFTVAGISDALLAGNIRRGGTMDFILRKAQAEGVPVSRFGIDDSGARPIPMKPALPRHDEPAPAPVFDTCLGKGSYLIHYTRSCPGPWPGQSRKAYYESLIAEEPTAKHTGFDTLCRILSERKIRASGRLIRGGYQVVSFTDCAPPEISHIAQWRPGLLRWSFEPYGLAFGRDDLFNRGARPVIYSVESAYDDLSPELQHLFQIQECTGKEWYREREWRMSGDLQITPQLEAGMTVIVPTAQEACRIRETYGVKCALAEVRPLWENASKKVLPVDSET